MQTSRLGKAVALAAMSIASWFACTALAQQSGSASGPAGFGFGPFLMVPGVDLQIGHDDNIFYSNANKKGSGIRILSPYVRLEGAPAPHKFDLAFRHDIGSYSTHPDDNYDDYALSSNAEVVFTGRAGLRLRA